MGVKHDASYGCPNDLASIPGSILHFVIGVYEIDPVVLAKHTRQLQHDLLKVGQGEHAEIC